LVELGRQLITATLKQLDWPTESVTELIVGVGMIEGGLMVPARQIAFEAGLPESLPTLTVDRACCSGTTTIGLAARSIGHGASSVLCLGIESMSRTPRLLHRSGDSKVGNLEVEDLLLLRSPLTGTPIASYVGEVALENGVSRSMQDEWALQSHHRYFQARERGFFDDEIVPVEALGAPVTQDEHPRADTSLEALAALPTVRDSPTVTAGNAPGLNDGACALVVAPGPIAKEQVRPPLARIAAYVQTAESPISSAYLPGVAIERMLNEFDLRPADLDVIEINEAFAATPMVSIRRLAIGDRKLEAELLARTNRNGGAVALGHPVGASGARLALTAARQLHEQQGRFAAVAICGGFGQTDALLLERVDD
jgi:acetyl-CoA C-acetyltransferase